MIYAATRKEIETRRKAFIRKWRLKHRAVADSLEEAGDRLFTFARLPPSQWRSVRTTNAIERLHEEFKRRIKTQTVLPSADTAAMLFWALLASGQISMRKVDWLADARRETRRAANRLRRLTSTSARKWRGSEPATALEKLTSGLPTCSLSRSQMRFERKPAIRYLQVPETALRNSNCRQLFKLSGFGSTSSVRFGLRGRGRFGSGGRPGAERV